MDGCKGLTRESPQRHPLLVCDDHDPIAVRRKEREAFPCSGQQLQLLRRRDVSLHRRSAIQDSVPIEEDEATSGRGPRGSQHDVYPSRLRRVVEWRAKGVPVPLPRRRVRAGRQRAGRSAAEAAHPPAARRIGRTPAARHGGTRRVTRVLDFLASRFGLVSLWRAFADEPVSVRRAWLFTLGSAARAVFLVQFVTGFALALAYAPTPDHAWESVKAIQTRLFAGGLVRRLHHWGASAMVVLAVAHMARTFAFGAYRRPRELNWLVGLALLVLVLGFGFTGYLLPWDQKAYWATVVGTKVPAALPFVGPAASRLMAGGPAVGAATLTRFYALHVVLLPLLAFAFISVHLLLLRRHSHAGPTTEPDPKEPFFPFQAARDGVVTLAVILALFWLAARHPAPLERLADPTDTMSVPRPEWYFLPLFQLLTYFKGPLEPIGTVVLPGRSMLLLALVPWLDRGASRRPRDRRPVLVFGGLVGARRPGRA